VPLPVTSWYSVPGLPFRWIGRECGDGGYPYPADQNEQWCPTEKSVSICGGGGTSDNICALPTPPNAGQGMAAEPGLPLAAKLAQAVRMLGTSVCWPGLSVIRHAAANSLLCTVAPNTAVWWSLAAGKPADTCQSGRRDPTLWKY
jgi:hypothetical protein